MRVECHTIADFLTNLKKDVAGVYRKIVYFSKTERSLDESGRGTVRFGINLQASAVIDDGDGGQYHLEYGEDCGIDYRDASNDAAGSACAADILSKLETFCKDAGLEIRPGIVQS